MKEALARKVDNGGNGKGKTPGQPLAVLNGGRGRSRFPDHSAWRLDSVGPAPESQNPASRQVSQAEEKMNHVREKGPESDGKGATVLEMNSRLNRGDGTGVNAFMAKKRELFAPLVDERVFSMRPRMKPGANDSARMAARVKGYERQPEKDKESPAPSRENAPYFASSGPNDQEQMDARLKEMGLTREDLTSPTPGQLRAAHGKKEEKVPAAGDTVVPLNRGPLAHAGNLRG